MSKLRFDAIEQAFKKHAVEVVAPEGRPSEYFGELVFNREKMQKYLDAKTLKALLDCIDNGEHLDRTVADGVAAGMKQWAMEHGVTHCCHWFQPLTETTAEKHDSFMEYDWKGGMIEEFEGKSLVQQEPDASSFPSGGIRATFEARGYTAWDPTSPVFILDDCLCIPTVFISYTGEALDYKAPLKKALKAVNDAAVPVCQLFDPNVKHVQSNLGWEQEYFLVDDALYAARPDLIATGRTLMGHGSSKNQQMEDHYFGQIPTRVQAFMKDLEIQGLRLGIPMKTRHNEVAPNQFEFAPIFGETNLAVDQNMLIMGVMKKVARRHGFRVLLHEKPFDGINGSGKHNNWSLSTDTGVILLAPGKDPMSNLQFVTFFVNILMSLKRHGGLLKASIASATNAHRLGANEAPPAIISAFLGKTMTDVLHKLLTVSDDTDIVIAGKQAYDLGLVEIPQIFVDNTDRNRTSPFAFTGNRFEFRAVGSKANCSSAMTTLNAMVAEQLIDFKAAVDKEMAAGASVKVAVMKTLKPLIAEIIDTVCFDGNGYAEEWPEEALKRGLDIERCVPKMFLENVKPEAVAMFEKLGVFTAAELEARNEVKFETYIKLVQIEARVLGDLAINHIIPAATTYQSTLLKNVAMMKNLFPVQWEEMASHELCIIKKIASYNATIKTKVDEMVQKRKVANKLEDGYEKALLYYEIAESFNAIRRPIDKLEEIVDDNIWPMPKYRELLWIR
ncbi:MAG: glutamine synthetase III [Bacteroidales bacterium]|nr:glutamine synthetase III [Bacteroidales bacterium]